MNFIGNHMHGRLFEVKQLMKSIDHKINHAAEDEEINNLVISLSFSVLHIYQNPYPLDHKEHKAEQFVINNAARYLVEECFYYLFHASKLESIYNIFRDPLSLSRSVNLGFQRYDDEEQKLEYESIATAALNLGGILDAKIISKAKCFKEGSFSSVNNNILVKLFLNLLENNWAQDPDAFSDRRYAAGFFNLLSEVTESYPEIVVRATLDHAEIVSTYDQNYFDTQFRHGRSQTKALVAACSFAKSSKFYLALHNLSRDLYTDFLYLNSTSESLCMQFVSIPEFNISNMPLHDTFSENFLAELFVSASSAGVMTESKHNDIQKLWNNVFNETSIFDVVKKTAGFKKCMKSYYDLLKNADKPLDVLYSELNSISVTYNSRRISHGLLYLDNMFRPAGKRVVDSEGMLDNHNVLMVLINGHKLESTDLDPMRFSTRLTGALIYALAKSENASIRSKLLTAFVEEDSHSSIKHLSMSEIKKLKKSLPELTDEILQKVNWDDYLVKSELIENALGL